MGFLDSLLGRVSAADKKKLQDSEDYVTRVTGQTLQRQVQQGKITPQQFSQQYGQRLQDSAPQLSQWEKRNAALADAASRNRIINPVLGGLAQWSPTNTVGNASVLAGSTAKRLGVQSPLVDRLINGGGQLRDWTAPKDDFAANGSLLDSAIRTGVAMPKQIAEFVANPLYSAANTYADVSTNQYRNAVAAGVDPNKAYDTAAILGGGSAALERIGLGKILGGAGGTAVRRIGTSMLTEGSTEGAQQLLENKIAQQTYDPNRSIVQGVPQAAGMGAVFGVAITGGVEGFNAVSNPVTRTQVQAQVTKPVANAANIKNDPEWRQHDANITKQLAAANEPNTPLRLKNNILKEAKESMRLRNERAKMLVGEGGFIKNPLAAGSTDSPLDTTQGNSLAQTPQDLGTGGQTQKPQQSRMPQVKQSQLESQASLVESPSSVPVIPQTAKDVQNILQGQEVKERGFAKTVRESSKTPKIGEIDNGTYVVKSDTQRIKDARDYIKSDPARAEQVALNPQNDMHVTIGNQLLDTYIATGQFEKFKKLNSGMAESGTEMGRAIHAFADYNKTTPSGAVKFAEKTISKYNKLNPNKQINLSNEDIKGLVTKAQEVQAMPEGRPRNIASQQLMEQVNNLIPSTFADKALTVWKAGLLTSPRTTMRNVIGNTVHGVSETIKDLPAALNDMLLSARTGKRSLTATTKGVVSGAKTGVVNAKDMMKYGFDPTQAIDKYDVRHVTWGESKPQQALKKYTDFVFHAMGAQDQPFYHAAFARSLYDQAGAAAINAGKRGNKSFIENLVKSPTEEMTKIATKDASTATFKDPNQLRELAGKIKNQASKNEISKVISEVVMPFTGVPSSIAGQMLQYSPIGLAKGVVKDIKVLAKNMPELQRQASQEIGRGVVGTGLMAIGAVLTAQGLMTGNPKDEKEAREWALEGKQANSVYINGKWRSINSVGPEALVTLAGSKIQSGVAEGKDTTEIAANIGKDFASQTFLQGVQGPLNAIADPNRYGGTYLKSQVASTIPNIVKDTAKAFDPTQRETNTLKDALQAGIPGARNKLLPKRDSLGNEMKQEPTGANAYIDLFNSKTPIKTEITQELNRLKDQDERIIPSPLDKKIKVDGTDVELTDKQRNDLRGTIGKTTQDYWKTTIATPEYKALDATKQAKVLSDIASDIRASEIRKFSFDNKLGQWGDNFTGKAGSLTEKQANIILDKFDPSAYLTTKDKTKAKDSTTKQTTTKKTTTKAKSTKSTARKAKFTIPSGFSLLPSGSSKGSVSSLLKNAKVTYKG